MSTACSRAATVRATARSEIYRLFASMNAAMDPICADYDQQQLERAGFEETIAALRRQWPNLPATQNVYPANRLIGRSLSTARTRPRRAPKIITQNAGTPLTAALRGLWEAWPGYAILDGASVPIVKGDRDLLPVCCRSAAW
jgi:hypothetical protein